MTDAIETVGCPGCSSREAVGVGFTWWGGVVGPKLLSHVRCVQCGTEYNARTGRSNTTAIAIYTLAFLVIFGGITLALTVGP